MSAENWKPWYERVADFDNAKEKEEFLRGVVGNKFASSKAVGASLVITGVLAGYLGHRIANKGKGK
jgi:hypothetical protein